MNDLQDKVLGGYIKIEYSFDALEELNNDSNGSEDDVGASVNVQSDYSNRHSEIFVGEVAYPRSRSTSGWYPFYLRLGDRDQIINNYGRFSGIDFRTDSQDDIDGSIAIDTSGEDAVPRTEPSEESSDGTVCEKDDKGISEFSPPSTNCDDVHYTSGTEKMELDGGEIGSQIEFQRDDQSSTSRKSHVESSVLPNDDERLAKVFQSPDALGGGFRKRIGRKVLPSSSQGTCPPVQPSPSSKETVESVDSEVKSDLKSNDESTTETEPKLLSMPLLSDILRIAPMRTIPSVSTAASVSEKQENCGASRCRIYVRKQKSHQITFYRTCDIEENTENSSSNLEEDRSESSFGSDIDGSPPNSEKIIPSSRTERPMVHGLQKFMSTVSVSTDDSKLEERDNSSSDGCRILKHLRKSPETKSHQTSNVKNNTSCSSNQQSSDESSSHDSDKTFCLEESISHSESDSDTVEWIPRKRKRMFTNYRMARISRVMRFKSRALMPKSGRPIASCSYGPGAQTPVKTHPMKLKINQTQPEVEETALFDAIAAYSENRISDVKKILQSMQFSDKFKGFTQFLEDKTKKIKDSDATLTPPTNVCNSPRDGHHKTVIDALEAYSQGQFERFYNILEIGHFPQKYHQVLQELWYEAHYQEHGGNFSLAKYRIRKRYPPPGTISDGIERTYWLTKTARYTLERFFESNPYPSTKEKEQLASKCRIHFDQVHDFFMKRCQKLT